METIIRQEIKRTADVLIALAQDNALISTIGFVSNLCINALKNGNKILFAGNGGSAADSQHLAAELVSRFNYDRPGLPAMALTTDTSILTAIGNDYGYENLFSRQIKALGKKGDVFIGLSTSGNSQNILKAIETAKALSIDTIGFTGSRPCELTNISDHCIQVPSSDTPKIQEGHIVIGHIICGLIEQNMFPK